MLRALFTLFFLIPVNITADALLSSPKLTLNSQGERVIEFKIQNSRISDDDILLKEYKSDEPLNQTYVAYTLLEDFSNYKTYSIVLSNSYDANYFNFKLVIKNELAKDISTEEGLIWKIWTENSVNKEAGGIYLFSDENNANRYLEKHKKRLNSFGIININAKVFDINVPLSLIDKANLALNNI